MKAGIWWVAVLLGVMGIAREVVADQSSLSPSIGTKTKYDAVYSMCGYMHSADQVPVLIERDNGVSPMTPIYALMFSSGMTVAQIKATPAYVKVLKGTTHGELSASGSKAFSYHANPGYLGSDQMVFEVETMGKKFKVIQTVIIDNSGNLDYPTPKAVETGDKICPSEKGSSLDIMELPTDGFASDEELAKLHKFAQLPSFYRSRPDKLLDL